MEIHSPFSVHGSPADWGGAAPQFKDSLQTFCVTRYYTPPSPFPPPHDTPTTLLNPQLFFFFFFYLRSNNLLRLDETLMIPVGKNGSER